MAAVLAPCLLLRLAKLTTVVRDDPLSMAVTTMLCIQAAMSYQRVCSFRFEPVRRESVYAERPRPRRL